LESSDIEVINSETLERLLQSSSSVLVVFVCSFIEHSCITDIQAFKRVAESHKMDDKLKFYYLDYIKNDASCDGLDFIKETHIRAYYSSKNTPTSR